MTLHQTPYLCGNFILMLNEFSAPEPVINYSKNNACNSNIKES